MGKVAIRDVSPALKLLRNFLLGRSHTLALRFEDGVATRSPPLPDLPEGPAHKLSANYYYSRDARREVHPPAVVAGDQAQLATGSTLQVGVGKIRTPGQIHNWD